MKLAKNEVVAAPTGYIIQYENRSWLCQDRGRVYWSHCKDGAAIFRSKIVAKAVAVMWDHVRKKAAQDMAKETNRVF